MFKKLFPWLRGLSLAWKLVVLLGLILLAMLAMNLLFGGNAEKVKADLGARQTGAALESGSDAVDTVGANAIAAQSRGEIVKGTNDAIDAAKNGADADAAARRGLCELSPDNCE